MKLTIKNIQIQVKRINGFGYLISDADANLIVNSRVTKSKRGRSISKEKLVDTDYPVKIGGVLYYPIVNSKHIDDCYFNNYMADKK